MTKQAESRHKTEFVDQCRGLGAYARRVEDQFQVGVLDMIVAFSGLPVCFLEGKKVDHITFGPTERQWIEGERIMSLKGGHSLALLVAWGPDNEFYVCEWARVASLKKAYYEQGNKNHASILYNYLRVRSSAGRPPHR